jgi:hypothetical protein
MEKNYHQLRFGGLKWGAAFFGWLVTVAIASLLLGLVTAVAGAAAINLRLDTTNLRQVGLWGTLIMLAVWVIAFYAGGYVAGRMTRFDGGRQGIGVWIINIIATLILSLLALTFGPVLNLLPMISLPHLPIGEGTMIIASAVMVLVALLLTALAAVAGGKAGQVFHRRIDDAALNATDQTREAAPQSPAPTPAETRPRPATPSRYAPGFGERIERTTDGADQKPRN